MQSTVRFLPRERLRERGRSGGGAFAPALTGKGPLRWRCAVLALLVLLTGHGVAAQVTVEASVEHDDVVVNQAFVMTIVVTGAQNVSPPSVYDLDGFEVGYLGPSTQLSFVNGRMSSTISHRYRVIALRAGDFQLGPFAVDVQGQRYETKPLPIHVAAAGSAKRGAAAAPAGPEGLRLVITPAKSEVYVGERVDLTLTLYVGNVRIRDLQYPTISADGVTLDKFSQPTEATEVVDGRRYHTVTLRTTMTPIRPGPVELNATMTTNMVTNRRGGMDSFFDQFFPGETKPVEVQAAAAPMTVLPLPEHGRPSDFTGAVGRFDFTLEAKPTTLDAGDPVTVRMKIAGTGNLSAVDAPTVPVDDRFRVYDTQPVKGEDSPSNRVFEQVVIPKVATVRELPAVRFSFFDPDTRAYQTITRGPLPLTVRAGPAAKLEVVEAEPRAAEPALPKAQPLGRDIVYIKDAPGALEARRTPLYQRGWFVLLQLLPPALVAALWAYTRRRDRLAADPRLMRFRQAGREARRALAALGQNAAEGQFYDELAGAVAAYLTAKLDLPPGAIERERVLARLDGESAVEMRQRIGAFFQLVEHARYAPSAVAAAERGPALDLAKAIVDGLERERRLERHLAALMVIALCCTGAVWSPAAEESAPQTAFFQGNQAYAEGRYADAIRAYESVRHDGADSGALEFNLGNAFFKDGQLARAIGSYERARRLQPRDPDVQANLSYALELAQVPAEPPALWKRIALPLATRATGSELAVFASLCWWSVWLLLGARLLWPRLRLGLARAAWAALALYAVAAGNLGLRLAEVELRDTAVVTAPGGTSVRFEPSATGTEHFPAALGTPLDVTEEHDDWLQVRRADGRRGWVRRDAVERVQ